MPQRQTVIRTLQVAKPKLIERYPIKLLAIFGSVRRGDNSVSSDVDILVEFSRPVGIEFIHLAQDLETLLQRKVDLVSRGGIKEKYFKVILPDLVYV